MPELAPLLKRLCLSGILDSLETHNREAVANKIPYTDFLALLIADEVARRSRTRSLGHSAPGAPTSRPKSSPAVSTQTDTNRATLRGWSSGLETVTPPQRNLVLPPPRAREAHLEAK